MAAIGKKNKKKWKSINTDIIIDSSRKPASNWEDEVATEFDKGNQFVHDNNLPSKIVLPTAPRASRGTAIDESKLPTTGPFQAYLSNIPYDLNEDELTSIFQDLKIKNVRLPREERGSRAKGFGYIEFEDRASLCTALSLGDPMLKGRIIKIELATNADSGRGGNRGRGNRDGGRDQTSSDRTTGNWRSGPRQEEPEERGGFDRGYGGSRREFGSGSGSSGFSRGGFDREERGFQRDDKGFDRGGRDDRGRDDRGFRDRYGDRGYGREGFGDRGGGGGAGGGGGGVGGGSSGGYRDRGRDEERFSRSDDRERGGQWRDEPRDRGAIGFGGGGGGRFEGRDRDGKYGPPRRDDMPPPRRDDLPPPRRDDLPPSDRESRTRQKLVLQPRTKPKEGAESASTSASIFGGAKPVDTAAREREIEERLMRSDEFSDSRSKGGPGSTGSRGEKQYDEKKVEPAPPPKENAWSRKPSQTVVNNGRSSPEDEVPHSSEVDETSNDGVKDKNADYIQVRGGAISSGRVQSGFADKPRGKDVDRPINKHRVRKECIDDISKMPKVPESKTPNFAGSNKFSSLVDSDEAPTE